MRKGGNVTSAQISVSHLEMLSRKYHISIGVESRQEVQAAISYQQQALTHLLCIWILDYQFSFSFVLLWN